VETIDPLRSMIDYGIEMEDRAKTQALYREHQSTKPGWRLRSMTDCGERKAI